VALQLLAAIGPPAREAGPAVAELLKEEDRTLRLQAAVVLHQIEADEIKQAVPLLVRMLRVEKVEDEKQIEERKKVSEVLVQIGRSALRELISAVEGEFSGGNPNLPVGFLNGHARLAAIQTLGQIAEKHPSPELLRLLARMEGTDPIPQLRMAARELRIKLQAQPAR
jgi:HEAT repeat protein